MGKIKTKKIILILVLTCVTFSACEESAKHEPYVLWQLDSQTSLQMNSYVLKTPNNKIIVIDGGYKEDASYLKGFLAALGDTVDLWFITHPHADHICALTEILTNPDQLIINKVYGSLPSENYVSKVSFLNNYINFNKKSQVN